jgi:type IV pilus assembly protein PilO
MALLPQDPRKQRLVLIAIMCVAGVGLYWNFVWTPEQQRLETVAERVEKLEGANARARTQVARGNAASITAEADQHARQLDVLRRLVPAQNEVPGLLDAISTAARQVGLDISDVAPDGVVEGDEFDMHRYKLGVTGPYHRVAQFLSNIGSLPRIIVPINVQLIPTQRQGLRQGADEQLLDAQFQVQTYVARTTPLSGGN